MKRQVTGDIAYRMAGPEEVASVSGRLEVLYRQCFAGPPWHESPHRLAGFGDR